MSRIQGYLGKVPVALVVAADAYDCIGHDGMLPWYLPSDLRYFKQLTSGHTCIAGSKTQASIEARIGGPLPNRTTVVLTRTRHPARPSVLYATHPLQALDEAERAELRNAQEGVPPRVFVIGGAETYRLLLPYVSTIYLTRVEADVNGDTHMPEGWLDDFELYSRQQVQRVEGKPDEYDFEIRVYERRHA